MDMCGNRMYKFPATSDFSSEDTHIFILGDDVTIYSVTVWERIFSGQNKLVCQ